MNYEEILQTVRGFCAREKLLAVSYTHLRAHET